MRPVAPAESHREDLARVRAGTLLLIHARNSLSCFGPGRLVKDALGPGIVFLAIVHSVVAAVYRDADEFDGADVNDIPRNFS